MPKKEQWKINNFCPKLWTNPLGKIQFGDYLKSIFLQPAQKILTKIPFDDYLKSTSLQSAKACFNQTYHQTFFLRQKKEIKKRRNKNKIQIFAPNLGLTPWEKSSLVTIKNQYFQTFFRGLFSSKEKMKKFLATNLYPNRYFYSLEKLVSYPEYHQTLLLGQFCQNTKKKFQIFVQNHGQPL